MKKIIIAALAIILPFCANAQSEGLFGKKKINSQQDLSAYLKPGAVPEVDGKVVFTQIIATPGKQKSEVYASLLQWADLRYAANTEHGVWNDKDYYKNKDYARVSEANKSAFQIVCTGDEEVVFSNKPLSKDFTRMNYILKIDVEEDCVKVSMSDIAYLYSLSETPERILAENWITDKEAISKKGKLLRISGKFRVKTIDIKNNLFEEITKAVTK